MDEGMLKFTVASARSYVPDGTELAQALQRTTHLGVGAHPDDLEFMGWHPILECIESASEWLTGVIVSDGRSSPRSGMYAAMSDEQMVDTRLAEQHHAAVVGGYGAMINLMHSEQGAVMAGATLRPLIDDLKQIVSACQPRVIWTHNLTDRHPHHPVVAVALIRALRELEYLPEQFYGGEVWRGLDWMTTRDKLAFDVSEHQNLTGSLMGVFDSQITGGKRYDVATAGRKQANATYHDPTVTDQSTALEYAMDLLPVLRSPEMDPMRYAGELIERFRREVEERLTPLWGVE
jgi:LmbE family N-acetylglucosaminyl deacetylase